MRVRRKVALITGASDGIGKALAIEFARHQVNLILIARRKRVLYDLKNFLESEYGVHVLILAKDLSSPHIARFIYQKVTASNIQVDYLVNNVGVGSYGAFTESSASQNELTIDLNIKLLTQLNHFMLPDMKFRGHGRVLNIASVAPFHSGADMAVYFASKAYVLSLSQALSQELRDSGVTVTALCPGPTETNFLKSSFSFVFRGKKEQVVFSPDEVAQEGYRAMMQGKPLEILGKNKRLPTAVKVLPRRLMTGVVEKVLRRK